MAASLAVGTLGDVGTIPYKMVCAPTSVAGEVALLCVVPDCIGSRVVWGLLGVHHVYIHFGLGYVGLRYFGFQFVYMAGTDCKWLVSFDEPARKLE